MTISDEVAYPTGAVTASVQREDGRRFVKVSNPCEDKLVIASPFEISASSTSKAASSALPCALCDAAPAMVSTNLEDLGRVRVICSGNVPECPKLAQAAAGSQGAIPGTTNVEGDRNTPLVCDGLPFTKYMIAGAIAGMTEHVAMFPVDTIKTRMQADPTLVQRAAGAQDHYATVPRAVRQILRTEGALGMYRGVSAMALGAGPAHAVYFAAYEKSKQILMSPGKTQVDPGVAAVSGALATVVSDAVALPMDVVKQRLQLPGSPYKGVWDCVSRVSREEGLKTFFRSYRTTILMNVPYTAVHFSVYETAKQVLGRAHGLAPDADLDQLEESLTTHLLAGGVAGGLAAAVTNPLDVVKTRQQTECAVRCPTKAAALDAGQHPNVYRCLTRIAAREGPGALLKGLVPRVMFHAPAAAICWTTYESLKTYLAGQ
mmetsp:Transcript_38288/g.83293  ORF Transcript_38288/g.83293 Transcript_38288/m.83293 type:complete len:431 (-) Transcript_38288:553-1845(-)